MDKETLFEAPETALEGIDSSEVMKEIDKLLDNRKRVFENDQRDFKVSKNIASGNGFSMNKQKNKNLNVQRARVCKSGMVMEPIVNAVVYKFSNDPFEYQTDAPLDKEELTFQLSSALREAATDGKSYLLIYVDGSLSIKVKKLNNFNVVMAGCDYADGADCKAAVYIDKKITDRKNRRKTQLAIRLQPVLEFSPDEIPFLTYWKLRENEDGSTTLCTYTIENDQVTDYDETPARYLPIVRCYAKEAYVDLDVDYRGLYYICKDTLKTIDYAASRLQERIAAAPTAFFTVSNQSLGDNLEQWENLNDKPKAFLAWDESDGVGNKNTPPQKNDLSVYTGEFLECLQADKQDIMMTLGVSAESAKAVPETAEAILLRKDNKDSATSELLKNLLDSAWQIARIVEDISGQPCRIVASVFDKMKKQSELEKIMALVQVTASNDVAMAALPSLVERMDLSPEASANLIMQIQSSKKPTQNEMALQQQLQQAGQQTQAMKDQLMSLNATLESSIYKEQFAYSFKIYEANMRQQIELKKLMLEEAKLQIAAGKNMGEGQLKLMELEQNIAAEEKKIQLEAARIAEDARQADMKSARDIMRAVAPANAILVGE
jgi:hypothetical protein